MVVSVFAQHQLPTDGQTEQVVEAMVVVVAVVVQGVDTMLIHALLHFPIQTYQNHPYF